nr:N-glycosylase/DNA lyase [Crypthecodinium cohnii]
MEVAIHQGRCSLSRRWMWPAGQLKRKCTSPLDVETFDLAGLTGPGQVASCSSTSAPAGQAPAAPSASFHAWTDLKVGASHLRPDATLAPGQSFGWKRLSNTDWLGRIDGSAVVVRQAPDTTLVRALHEADVDVDVAAVRRYLGLDVGGANLPQLYGRWSQACPRMREVARCLPGLRVLQQDPVETVFAFILSQNNNVSRICLLLDRLCAEYGQKICELPDHIRAIEGSASAIVDLDDEDTTTTSSCSERDDSASEGSDQATEKRKGKSKRPGLQHIRDFNARRALHSFPKLEVLAAASEQDLKRLGLGYRAAYVSGSAKALLELGGRAFLEGLCDKPRLEVQKALCQLPGIGPKVADCVALFCLRQHECIPVDVHVWRITTRDYEPGLRLAKSLTPKVYEQVGDAFRSRFGTFAGWAHSLLFGAELSSEARARLPERLLREMDAFREEQKIAAKQQREARAKTRLAREAEREAKKEAKQAKQEAKEDVKRPAKKEAKEAALKTLQAAGEDAQLGKEASAQTTAPMEVATATPTATTTTPDPAPIAPTRASSTRAKPLKTKES